MLERLPHGPEKLRSQNNPRFVGIDVVSTLEGYHGCVPAQDIGHGTVLALRDCSIDFLKRIRNLQFRLPSVWYRLHDIILDWSSELALRWSLPVEL